jgi:acetyl esterase/lipase
MAVQSRIVLEPSAQGIVDATAVPPFIYELEPAAARKVLDDLQADPSGLLPIDEEWITVAAEVGDARVRIIRPAGSSGTLPVISTCTAAAGSSATPALTTGSSASWPSGARAALLFVEYPNSPEAHYPVAIEQGYATAQWVVREGAAHGLDASRMAVAGESVGGNMAAALTLMAKDRGDVTFVQTSMYYPVTDAAMDTDSYIEFAVGYYLSRKSMEWFWDAYVPDPGAALGDHRLAEPGDDRAAHRPAAHAAASSTRPTSCATRARPTAAKLRAAGVPVTTVRYDGVVHDFMLLNAMSEANATRAAIGQATSFLRDALGTA